MSYTMCYIIYVMEYIMYKYIWYNNNNNNNVNTCSLQCTHIYPQVIPNIYIMLIYIGVCKYICSYYIFYIYIYVYI